jgi:hypothetical protein
VRSTFGRISWAVIGTVPAKIDAAIRVKAIFITTHLLLE